MRFVPQTPAELFDALGFACLVFTVVTVLIVRRMDRPKPTPPAARRPR